MGNLMAYAQDDLYYYLVAAKNLAAGHGSTFDGTTLTNGYHPLYFLVWWAMYHFATGTTGVFRLLAVLDIGSAFAIFVTSRALLARHLKRVWLSNGFALAVLSLCYPKLQHQMEVTLTLPLVLLFLYLLDRAPEEISVPGWLGAGAVGALMVLSRLDSVLLVAMFGLFAVLVGPYRRALKVPQVLAFLAGVLPMLVAYGFSNEVFFHRLSPVSGAAKQLRTVSGLTWKAFAQYPGVCVMLVVILIALGLLFLYRGRFTKEQRVIYAAALAFPVVHWLLEIWSSDWNVWPWYTYSLRAAMLIVFLLAGLAFSRSVSPRVQQVGGIAVFAVFLVMAVHRRFPPEAVMTDIYSAARGIREFAQSHPGRYAMGDRAGMVGYLNDQPVVQLEGLMMDGEFLGHIRRQDPLRDVLKDYKVDYYVGFSQKLSPDWKPAQAGPSSPTMRGEFCEQPIWTLVQKSGETMIFDVRGDGSASHAGSGAP